MLFHKDLVSVIYTYKCAFILDQDLKYFSYSKIVLIICENSGIGDRE